MNTLNFSYNGMTDILTVEGIHYSGELFRQMATLPIGSRCPFDLNAIIVDRQDRVVTMKREK